MAITSGLTLLQKLQKLFGARAVSDMMGQTTNVQTLAKGTNNPFANTFSSKYLAKNKDGVEEASKVIIENMQYAFGNKNARQMKNFENNVDTLYNIKFPQKNTGTKQAEILDLKTKKPVTEEGIASLKKDLGLPENVPSDSALGELLLKQKRLETQLDIDMKNVMKKEASKKTKGDVFMDITKASAKPINIEREGQVRTASREFLNREIKLGKIKLKPEETKSILQPSGGGTDPIDILRTYYGEDVLEALDNLAPKFMQAEKYSDYLKIMDNNLDKSFFKPRKDPSIRQSYTDEEMRDIVNKKEKPMVRESLDDEAVEMAEQSDLDDDIPFAQGGIAGQLHLNEGGRVGLQEGGLPTVKSVGGVPNVEGGRIVYDLGNGSYIYESPDGYEIVENGIYTSLGTKEYSDGSARPLKHLFEDGIIMRRANDPILLEQQAQSAKTAAPTIAAPTIAAPTIAAPTIAAPTIAAPTPTGIQTTPGDKKTFNVMMDEKGNVQDDQSLTELFRETGTAPYIGQNNQINSMSDVFRLAGITNEGGISMGTDYGGSRTLPSGGIANTLPSVEQRMQAAAAKGLDARMGRTYAENIQAMADPRMATQMPPMPIDLMPPMSSEFRQGPGEFADPNVSAANPGGYASQDEAIADLGIERYNQLYNMGGRVGFKNGGMDRRAFLKLMGGLASLPVLGKFFKGAKVASKIPMLKNTTTTMPAWFPDLVDKFVAKGVGKKIDKDMIEYTVKELPDVKMIEKTDGMISVEGKNAYNEDYFIQYEPPGYTVVDEKTGKAVKTPGEFVATDTEYRMISPEDYDIDGVNVDDIDEILGGSSNQLEGFAKGTGKTKNTIGQRRIDEADARGASSKEEYGRTERADVYDPYEGMDPTDFVDPEDFAKGGLAGQLL